MTRIIAILAGVLALCACENGVRQYPVFEPAAISATSASTEAIEVPPPPFSKGIFPCSDCHADMEPNPTRRTLTEAHEDIRFTHDAEHRWCLDCHDAADRDVLHLASGEKVPFTESYRLCGQCHGDKFRDWRVGVHGRRRGEWNGHKTYLLCVHCHNPHHPKFEPLQPMPPPVRPVAGEAALTEASDE